MDDNIPSAPGWINYTLGTAIALIGGLLGVAWGWLRGDITDLKKTQESFVKSDTVARIEERQNEMIGIQGRFVTHDDLREELEARFNEMDTRRLQMHNNSMQQINQLTSAVEGLRSDIREDLSSVRKEVGEVHRRIDSGLRRRAEDHRES